MAEPQKKKSNRAIYGINVLRYCKLRQSQMEYILENMTEPDFSLIDDAKAAKDTKNANDANDAVDNVDAVDADNSNSNADNDDDVLNTAGITWRLLNHQGFGSGAHHSTTPPSWPSVANFMANIQDYLPKNLRTHRHPRKLWSRHSFILREDTNIAEYTQELLEEMCEWLVNMKAKIEDHIASRYFVYGKNQLLETLKRRYKDSWGDRIEQVIDANVSDRTIEVKFEQL